MVVRTSASIVALYLVGAGVVVLGSYVGYRSFVLPAVERSMSTLAEEAPGGIAVRGDADALALERERAQRRNETLRKIRQLQQLLDRKTALLQKKDQLLEKKTAECETLRIEVDKYMVSMLQMVNEAPFPGEIPLAQDRVAPSANRAEMDQITTQLSENEAQDQRLEEELAAVRSELDEAYALIASETPADAAQSESGLLGLEATQMLVELGEASVPHLARALTDDRPAVRLWAAETLGQIGPDAVEATDALLLAARDAVPAVRDAAHRALVRIDDSF